MFITIHCKLCWQRYCLVQLVERMMWEVLGSNPIRDIAFFRFNKKALLLQYYPSQGKWPMFYILPQQLEWIRPSLSLQRFNTFFVSNRTLSCLLCFVNFSSTFLLSHIWVNNDNVLTSSANIFSCISYFLYPTVEDKSMQYLAIIVL